MEESRKAVILEQVMIEYGDELVRLAFIYVKDKEVAKDLVQNAFIKCYRNLEHFRYEAKLKTWLYRITINECKDYFKTWHYQKVRAREWIHKSIKATFPSAESKVISQYQHQAIRDLVFALPDMYREVIYLYYYHSLKIDEISEVTKVPVSTVKTRLRRAKQKLKLTIEEEDAFG